MTSASEVARFILREELQAQSPMELSGYKFELVEQLFRTREGLTDQKKYPRV